VFGSVRTDRSLKWKSKNIKVHVTWGATYFPVFEAFKAIEKYTCIRFTFMYDELKNENGINVLYAHRCGFDQVGKRSGKKPNEIYLGSGCYSSSVHIQGFILQILGLDYEHNRMDRDKYIDIRNDSIKPEGFKYFEKGNSSSTKSYGTNYDYGSITHGLPTAFSKSGGITIQVKDKKNAYYYQRMIGQRKSVSFNEYKLINFMYCNKTCSKTKKKPECWFGGYQNPNDCEKCLCPYPLAGYKCQGFLPMSYYCSRITSFTARRQVDFFGFKAHTNCYALVQTPKPDQRIHIRVRRTWLSNQEICTRDYSMLEIKYKADKSLMGVCFCGAVYDHEFDSESDVVYFIYHGYRISQSATIWFNLIE
uniref:Metalloendopeptidase n=1 Tax=Parastrongyloides trichosuri TaxID=131310 RepID=A0A0N4ZEP2_PARTI